MRFSATTTGIITSLLLSGAATASHLDPFEIMTEGMLSVDFETETFTLTSSAVNSTPSLGLDVELAAGTAVFGPDEVITAGLLSFTGPTGTIDGIFSGTIPIVDGDFGLGIGLFSVTAATGDFADWVGLVIPFTSDCGNLDASGNSSYVNHYSAAVPEPSTAALASLGFLCLGIFGPALRGRSPRPCTRVIRTR